MSDNPATGTAVPSTEPAELPAQAVPSTEPAELPAQAVPSAGDQAEGPQPNLTGDEDATSSTTELAPLPVSGEQGHGTSHETAETLEQTPDVSAEGGLEPLSTEEYDVTQHRIGPEFTTYRQTLLHLIKSCLGTGILAMPMAFRNSGHVFGFVCFAFITIICTYCIHILVESSHALCRKLRVPSLDYTETAVAAFETGSLTAKKLSNCVRLSTKIFLVIYMLGACSVYLLFAAQNITLLMKNYVEDSWQVRYTIMALAIPMVAIVMMRDLKKLSVVSAIANVTILLGIVITCGKTIEAISNCEHSKSSNFSDIEHLSLDSTMKLFSPTACNSTRSYIADFRRLPLFFGTAIFALEGIGLVMALENTMRAPRDFVTRSGVLNVGMIIVFFLYSLVGLLGYFAFGDETKGSVTLNLPRDDMWSNFARVTLTSAILGTYPLQFHVPAEIVWTVTSRYFGSDTTSVYWLRAIVVAITVVLPLIIPRLGPVISLVGATCLSMLGLIFPALIHSVLFWEDLRLKRFVNVFIVMFGICGFGSGTYYSIMEMIE